MAKQKVEKKKTAFGGTSILTDAVLAPVFGEKEGTLVTLGQMNKKIWEYIKAHKLKVDADGNPLPDKKKKDELE
jgi:chromatin remodeling complex protein RSC6